MRKLVAPIALVAALVLFAVCDRSATSQEVCSCFPAVKVTYVPQANPGPVVQGEVGCWFSSTNKFVCTDYSGAMPVHYGMTQLATLDPPPR